MYGLATKNYSRMMMVVIIIITNFEIDSDVDEINAPDHAVVAACTRK